MAVVEKWASAQKITNFKDYESNDFKSEKELCDFIEWNIQPFVSNVLEESGSFKYKREFNLNQIQSFGPRPRRIDFYVEREDGKGVLIEVKNPKNCYSEVNNAISQIMSYIVTAKNSGVNVYRAVLVTSRYHKVLKEVINEFQLPIEVFVISKKHILKLFN